MVKQRSNLLKNNAAYRTIGRMAASIVSYMFPLFSRKDRVRVIVTGANDTILLVKTILSRQTWALPGGGVKRGEDYDQAARREVFEEVGLAIKDLNYAGSVNEGKIQNSEIIETAWFDAAKLPPEYKEIYLKASK